MKIVIESTDQLTTFDGTPCRVWEGRTERGVLCKVFVLRLAVRDDADVSQFEAELREMLPPGRHIPLSMILRH